MNDDKSKPQTQIVDTLFDVGEAWASYGLKVAELALTASARTLTGVSKVLGNLADELKHEQHEHANVVETHGR
jgi:hypothetical protein